MTSHPAAPLKAALFACCLAFCGSSAAQPQRYGVFVYSNLCIEAESGDTAGNRITLHRFAEGDTVQFEYSEGALALPLLGQDLRIDRSSGRITFRIAPPGEEMQTVEGVISGDGRMLKLHRDWCGGADNATTLKRVRRFSQVMTQCAPCPSR